MRAEFEQEKKRAVNVATRFGFFFLTLQPGSKYFDISQKHILDHNKYFCRSLERDLERLKADHATEVKDQIIILYVLYHDTEIG